MTFKERNLLPIGTWNDTEQLFLPSKVLDLVHLAHPYISEGLYKDIALLSWCSEDEVRTYLANKKEDVVKDYESSLHIARWRTHDLFSKSKTALEEMCKRNNLDHDDTKSRLVEKLCQKLQLKEPDEVAKFDGDLSVIPTKVKEISKLPVFKLKQFLHFCGIPWSGNKDQLVLRVLAP